MNNKLILDACCGGRMMWFDKKHPLTLYVDKRIHERGENKHRPNFSCIPDEIVDFRNMPYKDNTFKLVVFDPPHIFNASKGSVIGDYYGHLNKETWMNDIKSGFDECLRVVDNYGVVIFKWNEVNVKRGEVLKVLEKEPLFGQRPGGRGYGGTHWLCFMKIPDSTPPATDEKVEVV